MKKLGFIIDRTISQNYIKVLIVLTAIIISLTPLLMKFPFNINIYLAWEGAYRIFLGQIPSIDFYLPLGFVFWIMPAFFFKIFGPNLYTLIIFQSFVNLLTFFVFGHILRLLKVNYYTIFIAFLVIGLSYILLNFWPWYNNFVFVLQLLSILFILLFRDALTSAKKNLYLVIAAVFSVLAFFTKQDGGGLTILINGVIVAYICIRNKEFKRILLFGVVISIFSLFFVLPFLKSDIAYWFNHGQAPHYSRLNIFTYLNELFKSSQWIKFYSLIILLVLMLKYKSLKELLKYENDVVFLLLIIGILFEASVIQVTSYIPHYSSFYYHGFAFAYIFSQFDSQKRLYSVVNYSVIVLFIILLWSADTWKYGLRIGKKILPGSLFEEPKNVISKDTWLNANDTVFDNRKDWILSDFKTMKNIYLPPGTVAGMTRLVDKYKGKDNLKVLNMSELTMLAKEIGYTPLIGHPLWFHKNVAIFDREIAIICKNIHDKEYDLVLFESIPILNEFYPDEINQCLRENYKLIDNFRAPRREYEAKILVYIK